MMKVALLAVEGVLGHIFVLATDLSRWNLTRTCCDSLDGTRGLSSSWDLKLALCGIPLMGVLIASRAVAVLSSYWHWQGQNDVTAEDLALRVDICHQIFGDAVGALVRGACCVLDARTGTCVLLFLLLLTCFTRPSGFDVVSTVHMVFWGEDLDRKGNA